MISHPRLSVPTRPPNCAPGAPLTVAGAVTPTIHGRDSVHVRHTGRVWAHTRLLPCGGGFTAPEDSRAGPPGPVRNCYFCTVAQG